MAWSSWKGRWDLEKGPMGIPFKMSDQVSRFRRKEFGKQRGGMSWNDFNLLHQEREESESNLANGYKT